MVIHGHGHGPVMVSVMVSVVVSVMVSIRSCYRSEHGLGPVIQNFTMKTMTIEPEQIPRKESYGPGTTMAGHYQSHDNRLGPLRIEEISENEFINLYREGNIRIRSWRRH